MHIDQRKEQFSLAYLHAVAAVAGCAVADLSVDDDSIDRTLSQKRRAGAYTAPKLDVQLKGTHLADFDGNDLRYALKVKNYGDLIDDNVLVPRILIVVVVPEELTGWCDPTEERMVLRRCGYWTSLRGQPATNNNTTVTVRLPRANLFTPDALTAMMLAISERGRL